MEHQSARKQSTLDAIKILGGVHVVGIGIGVILGLVISIRMRRPTSEIRT